MLVELDVLDVVEVLDVLEEVAERDQNMKTIQYTYIVFYIHDEVVLVELVVAVEVP